MQVCVVISVRFVHMANQPCQTSYSYISGVFVVCVFLDTVNRKEYGIPACPANHHS